VVWKKQYHPVGKDITFYVMSCVWALTVKRLNPALLENKSHLNKRR